MYRGKDTGWHTCTSDNSSTCNTAHYTSWSPAHPDFSAPKTLTVIHLRIMLYTFGGDVKGSGMSLMADTTCTPWREGITTEQDAVIVSLLADSGRVESHNTVTRPSSNMVATSD